MRNNDIARPLDRFSSKGLRSDAYAYTIKTHRKDHNTFQSIAIGLVLLAVIVLATSDLVELFISFIYSGE